MFLRRACLTCFVEVVKEFRASDSGSETAKGCMHNVWVVVVPIERTSAD